MRTSAPRPSTTGDQAGHQLDATSLAVADPFSCPRPFGAAWEMRRNSDGALVYGFVLGSAPTSNTSPGVREPLLRHSRGVADQYGRGPTCATRKATLLPHQSDAHGGSASRFGRDSQRWPSRFRRRVFDVTHRPRRATPSGRCRVLVGRTHTGLYRDSAPAAETASEWAERTRSYTATVPPLQKPQRNSRGAGVLAVTRHRRARRQRQALRCVG